MSKHTPGPWKAQAWNNQMDVFPAVETHPYRPVAVMFNDMPKDERDANARLIAAAPDLLDALKLTEPYCPVDVQDVIRAAIRKVKA